MKTHIAVDLGDAQAQFNWAMAYYNRQGVPKVESQAVDWIRKAAEQGNQIAMEMLTGR